MHVPGRRLLTIAMFFAACGLVAAQADAQLSARSERGFRSTLNADPMGDELTAQPDMWALEVSFKPVRMIWIESTDPQSAGKRQELVWYLVYKVVNREFEQRPESSEAAPVNDLDERPRPVFAPEITLVTDDHGEQHIYDDVVYPEAQQAIINRERQQLQNSVEIAGELPELTPKDARMENARYGVAIFRNVDPTTDKFNVFLSGFSSAYKLGNGPDGKSMTLRRTIALEYDRKGDEFDETEKEVNLSSEPRWIYRPDDSAGDADTVAARRLHRD